jgi:ubiquinol oxidase
MENALPMDLTIHHEPRNWSDRIAYGFTQAMRLCANALFTQSYGHRVMVMETVAAVPSMVAAMHTHLRCLRSMSYDQGKIRALLEQAENERMHLMTFTEVVQPTLVERILIIAVQWAFYVAFFILYLISARTAHRVVGYLEEEAIVNYTQYLAQIDAGSEENIPAPAIARHYWKLAPKATLRDVVVLIRADEAHHRDVNHGFADEFGGDWQPKPIAPYPKHAEHIRFSTLTLFDVTFPIYLD